MNAYQKAVVAHLLPGCYGHVLTDVVVHEDYEPGYSYSTYTQADESLSVDVQARCETCGTVHGSTYGIEEVYELIRSFGVNS